MIKNVSVIVRTMFVVQRTHVRAVLKVVVVFQLQMTRTRKVSLSTISNVVR